jgi:Spy/CpxP family protein refolding chaperone
METMKNKLIKCYLLLIFMVGAFAVNAQQQNDEIQMIQSKWGIEKRAIVSDYMKLTPEEATAFWPLYDEYQNEYKELGKERINILIDYANNLATLTNEKADELVTRMKKNNRALDDLQYKYYKKMKKVITPLRAAQFLQLDSYIQTMIKSDVQNNIPFIGELDKKMDKTK